MLEQTDLKLSLNEALRYEGIKNGVFQFRKEIDRYNVEDLLIELTDVCTHPENYQEITIRLTSPGGNAYDAFCIYDVLREISSKGVYVKIIVEGIAASAAAMVLLQAADERISLPNASFLLHEARRWIMFVDESKSEMEDEVAEMKRITDKIVEMISIRCDKTKDEINELIERREVWMSAENALDWNLIDRILGRNDRT